MKRIQFPTGLIRHSALTRVLYVMVFIAILWAAVQWAVMLP